MTGEPWLILPTYNEAANVEAILAAAGEVLGGAAPEGFRILVVDDGSPDGTGRLADEMASRHDWVRSCTGPRRRASARPTWPGSGTRSTKGPAM